MGGGCWLSAAERKILGGGADTRKLAHRLDPIEQQTLEEPCPHNLTPEAPRFRYVGVFGECTKAGPKITLHQFL